MIATCLVLATTALGVDTGWQPTDDGSLEYIIQIDRRLLASMLDGESIVSEIPPEVGSVRRYRIMVGNAELPREGRQPVVEASEPPPGPLEIPPAKAPLVVPPAKDPLDIPQTKDPLDIPSPQNPLPEMPQRYEVPPVLDQSADVGEMPKTFDPNSSGEIQASHIKSYKPAEESPSDRKDVSSSTASKPWVPLILSTLALVASLAANFYLVWIWLEARRRYRDLALERTGNMAV